MGAVRIPKMVPGPNRLRASAAEDGAMRAVRMATTRSVACRRAVPRSESQRTSVARVRANREVPRYCGAIRCGLQPPPKRRTLVFRPGNSLQDNANFGIGTLVVDHRKAGATGPMPWEERCGCGCEPITCLRSC